MTDTSKPTELSPVKQALLEIRQLRSRLAEVDEQKFTPIAVTGVAVRFPGGANDPEQFWKLLVEGVDTVAEVPADRWDIGSYYSPEPQTPGKMNTRWGAFLDKVDQFDPRFFGISPREAETMDPQQRLLLEVAWEALERAGQSPDDLFDSQTGVYLGISNSDYYRKLLSDVESLDVYVTTGNALSVAGGRLSYQLGLHGPNLSIDTACSSSLVAAHLACQSLRSRETDVALVGGVNLILSPEISVNFSIANMMAPDGHCKTFDAAADGYVRGEGCAVLVLKRLADAQADGSPILAVIRGTAVNHDGRSGGLTAPNGPAQAAVIRKALEDARIQPEDVSYVETHGTGTSLGDPIEVGALLNALCKQRGPQQPLYLGAVKTNIGHLEAAAGVAGLVKAILALQHGQIPPNLHFQTLNPHIQFGGAPVIIPTTNIAWAKSADQPRVVGVSSFGLSGTNAHIILSEAPRADNQAETSPGRSVHVLTLSAKSEGALRELSERMSAHLAAHPDQPFEQVCFTSNTGRAAHPHRLAIVSKDAEEARQKLGEFIAGQPGIGTFQGYTPPSNQTEVTFLFTGHGSSYVNMGRKLYESQPVFRAVIDECDQRLRGQLELPLVEALYPQGPVDVDPLKDMRIAQPALFALQVALAKLWQSWGISPTFVTGHSAGEYAAACLAGVLTVEDALKLITARGQVLQSLASGGRMVAVFAPESQVAEMVARYPNRVSIAALNAPTNTVISGESAAIAEILLQLEEQGVKYRALSIAQGAHSPLIEPGLDSFEQLAGTIHYGAPSISLISSVTGGLVESDTIAQPAYWRKHLRQPVQFLPAMQSLYRYGQSIFLEIGPNPVLTALGQRCLLDGNQTWLASLHENLADDLQMQESLALLWTQGFPVNWRAVESSAHLRRVILPTYPFQRSRYWRETRNGASHKPAAHPVWGQVIQAAGQQSQQGPHDLMTLAYPGRWAMLERLVTAYVARAFRQWNVFCTAGERWSPEKLIAERGIQPVYRALVGRWFDLLARAGYLQEMEGQYQSAAPLPMFEVDALLQEAAGAMADLPMVIEYIQRCGERLPAILTGASSALDTLFPDGSSRLAEALYQNWAVSRYYALIVRAAVETAVKAALAIRPAGQPARILEIGAGTGATTTHVLPGLPEDRVIYDFTDISDLFLNRAAKKFQAYPMMRFRKLDIEKDPVEQGYAPNSFDVIIATNVLHAVPDLNRAVENARDLLAPGGLLVINEVTTHLAWFDITTGLIEGWQSFEDDLRKTSPLISQPDWIELLHQTGFENVAAWPEPGQTAWALSQSVLIAQDLRKISTVDLTQSENSADAGVDFAPAEMAASTDETPVNEWLTQLAQATADEQFEQVLAFVRQQLGLILRLKSAQSLERGQRLMDLGLDSLMALELRAKLNKGLGLKENALSATLAFDYPTIQALTEYILKETLSDTAQELQPSTTLPQEPPRSSREEEIAGMSDAEIEAMLIQKLNKRQSE